MAGAVPACCSFAPRRHHALRAGAVTGWVTEFLMTGPVSSSEDSSSRCGLMLLAGFLVIDGFASTLSGEAIRGARDLEVQPDALHQSWVLLNFFVHADRIWSHHLWDRLCGIAPGNRLGFHDVACCRSRGPAVHLLACQRLPLRCTYVRPFSCADVGKELRDYACDGGRYDCWGHAPWND